MNRIKELRQKNGMTQEELGASLGVQKAAISKYETERVPIPNSVLVKLCDLFNVTADYLLERNMVTTLFKTPVAPSKSFLPITDAVGVPLIGRVHAGLPMLADENIEEYISVDAADVRNGEYFYLRVEGDCMIGEFIPEGALVLVRAQPTVENGKIAVVRFEDEVLLRRVKFLDGNMLLIPANVKYEPIVVPLGEAEIVGRVVEVRIRGL